MTENFTDYLGAEGLLKPGQLEQIRGLISKVREPIGSIAFSYGSHDEWNILRLINVKRLGGTQFGVANQIASFYDGRPTPPSAAEQTVSNGYMGRCNF